MVDPPRHRTDGLLPVSSPLRHIARPTATAFAGGRALLMELAHPSIARAVADFDHFNEDPARRAQLTAKAFRDVIYGSEVEAAAVGRRLNAVHARVRGAGHAATDPELLLWVHATFIDSLLRVGQHLYGALSDDDLADYYRDAVVVGEVFGCPATNQPATVAPLVAPATDRAFYALADGNGRGVSAALALAGIRSPMR